MGTHTPSSCLCYISTPTISTVNESLIDNRSVLDTVNGMRITKYDIEILKIMDPLTTKIDKIEIALLLMDIIGKESHLARVIIENRPGAYPQSIPTSTALVQ